MKARIIVIGVIALIAISTITAIATTTVAKITIFDQNNTVRYDNFGVGDIWNITLYIVGQPEKTNNTPTRTLAYQFNGTITGDPYFVWFGNFAEIGQSGTHKCIVPGSYEIKANGSRILYNKTLIINNIGNITLEANNACSPPIPPISELSTVILTTAGLIGILLVSRKYKS